jgi:hypothetical protein
MHSSRLLPNFVFVTTYLATIFLNIAIGNLCDPKKLQEKNLPSDYCLKKKKAISS